MTKLFCCFLTSKIKIYLFTGIFAYEPSICRALAMTHRYEMKYRGLPAVRYELNLGEDINVKKCFCREEDTCPPKGTIDLYRCTGVPMIASLPHFYLAEELLNDIESGLHPNKKEHGVHLNLEIVSHTHTHIIRMNPVN